MTFTNVAAKEEGFTRGGMGFAGGMVITAAAILLKLGLLRFIEKKNI